MTWQKTPESRARDAQVYGSPEYKRNRTAVLRQANGHCSQCGHRHRLQVDHVIPVSRGGTHAVGNLRALCAGDGTCKCHETKTAAEGGGWRASRGDRTPRDPQPRPRTNW